MKVFSILIFAFTSQFANAQAGAIDYVTIDQQARTVDASSPSQLAEKLTSRYKTTIEKARAIFSWVAQRISYDDRPPRIKTIAAGIAHPVTEDDSSLPLKPVNELVAEEVIAKRVAVCDGYARLFKWLCDFANIPCEIISGYARGDFNRVGTNFRTNHSWNAVQLDSTWYLVDATWASGYFPYNSNQFIPHFDDRYFLANPAEFARDHFPDDLRWTLLQHPAPIGEFLNSPYKGKSFSKYSIAKYWPGEGVIHAAAGDTIRLNVQFKLEKDRYIAGGSLDDSLSFLPGVAPVYCKPTRMLEGVASYEYVVDQGAGQWIDLVYNGDMILRYYLVIGGKN